MSNFKLVLIICLSMISHTSFAQEIPENVFSAIKSDDPAALSKLVIKDNINGCYGNYSLLSDAIRYNAKKCFDWLVAEGADVNHVCNGYISPLMHASKYGRLDMVKVLVAQGADIHFTYHGSFKIADGCTPLMYAQKFNMTEVVDYLQTLK